MAKKKYTIILIPDSGDETKEFLFSRRTMKAMIYLSLILVSGVVTLLVWSIPKALNYNRISLEQEFLKEKQLKIAEVIRDLNRIKHMDTYIRNVLGVDLEIPLSSDIPDTSQMRPDNDQEHKFSISYLDNIPSYRPVEGFITRSFNEGNIELIENHYGIDIAAKEGAGINAAASGMVVFSGWTTSYGNLVILYHGDVYFSLYGHNQINLVEGRQWIDRGQLIALVGQTGDVTGPHLHFEIWKDGQPVDPADYIEEFRNQQITGKDDGTPG
ncbi:MAG: M23 family metallopeptidase [Thermodesulfobacteriota bacterium]